MPTHNYRRYSASKRIPILLKKNYRSYKLTKRVVGCKDSQKLSTTTRRMINSRAP